MNNLTYNNLVAKDIKEKGFVSQETKNLKADVFKSILEQLKETTGFTHGDSVFVFNILNQKQYQWEPGTLYVTWEGNYTNELRFNVVDKAGKKHPVFLPLLTVKKDAVTVPTKLVLT